MKVLTELRKWYQHGWLRAIDLSLAEYLAIKGESAEVVLLGALVSHQLGRGHPCLDLQQLQREPQHTLQLPPEHASAESRQQCLSVTALLGMVTLEDEAQLHAAAAVNQQHSPLVLQDQRLYLRRYWNYEQQIKQDLATRMAATRAIDPQQLCSDLDDLFGATDTLSWQRLACALAVRSGFTIITGGPGTGKTYTVVRLLALLQRQRSSAEPLRIRLAAPTGKAAARMQESINKERANLPARDQAELPEAHAETLHRLLGSRPHSRSFRHNRQQPLVADILIIDEASMVDIEMLAAITAALPAHASLILLGDKDQLASVEAGAVLGQLCADAQAGHYAPELAHWLASTQRAALPEHVVDEHGAVQWPYLQHTMMLHESRRFDASKGIGKLAFEINRGVTRWLQDWLRNAEAMATADAAMANIHRLQVTTPQQGELKRLVQRGYQPLLDLLDQAEQVTDSDTWGRQLLWQLQQFQVLCALREGDWGMLNLNRLVSQWLFAEQAEHDNWYVGRAVMVTHNDYSLDLRNGDIGLVVKRPEDGSLRVLFMGDNGKLRWLLPSRLAHIETAFAMTIHKSQGSEFTHTVVVMPDRDAPILTKELLYTGITRASQEFTLVVAQPELVIKATERRVERIGGLA